MTLPRPSVGRLWRAWLATLPAHGHDPQTPCQSWYFGDTETDANTCAELVLSGAKRATAPSLWSFEASGEPIPRPGDVAIVTNWAGDAQCVIATTRVDIVAYRDVDAEFAFIEGEGDKSLAYWREVHWPYYQRDLEGTPFVRSLDMPIVCEQFRVLLARDPDPPGP